LVEGGRAGKKFRKNTEGGEEGKGWRKGCSSGQPIDGKSESTPLTVVTQLGSMLPSYVLVSAEFKA
jgi:hypothetical protein